MFYSLKDFNFLTELIDNKDIIYSEYLNYKKAVNELSEFSIQKKHLLNLETYNLFTSFVMCIYTKHKIGTGQVTNGLFNFSYFMPDRSFSSLKPFFEKKFDDLYYQNENNLGMNYFTKTLLLLKSIPNLTQAGYSEYKNKCIFDPHVHENNIFIFHLLLNPCKNNIMHITSNGQKSVLDKNNHFIIFKGGDLHDAVIECESENIITLGLAFIK